MRIKYPEGESFGQQTQRSIMSVSYNIMYGSRQTMRVLYIAGNYIVRVTLWLFALASTVNSEAQYMSKTQQYGSCFVFRVCRMIAIDFKRQSILFKYFVLGIPNKIINNYIGGQLKQFFVLINTIYTG